MVAFILAGALTLTVEANLPVKVSETRRHRCDVATMWQCRERKVVGMAGFEPTAP